MIVTTDLDKNVTFINTQKPKFLWKEKQKSWL